MTASVVFVHAPGAEGTFLRRMLSSQRLSPDRLHHLEWDGSWERTAEVPRPGAGPTVFLSSEPSSDATQQQVMQLVESLRPAEVQVVVTVRDLARQLPFDWQNQVKLGYTGTLQEFVRGFAEHGTGGDLVHPVRVLGTWRAAVPPDRIHVVTVPPPEAPAQLLWERVADVLGIDPVQYRARVAGADTSVGAAEVEVIRRINLTLGNVLGDKYDSLIREYLAETVLAARPNAIPITFPAEFQEWAVARSKELVQELYDAGYDVVGDLEELHSAPAPQPADRASAGNLTEAQLDAAVDAMVGLVQWVARFPGQGRPVGTRVKDMEEELAARRRYPFRTFVRDLSDRHRTVMRARVAWWHGVELAQRLRGRLIGG